MRGTYLFAASKGETTIEDMATEDVFDCLRDADNGLQRAETTR